MTTRHLIIFLQVDTSRTDIVNQTHILSKNTGRIQASKAWIYRGMLRKSGIDPEWRVSVKNEQRFKGNKYYKNNKVKACVEIGTAFHSSYYKAKYRVKLRASWLGNPRVWNDFSPVELLRVTASEKATLASKQSDIRIIKFFPKYFIRVTMLYICENWTLKKVD